MFETYAAYPNQGMEGFIEYSALFLIYNWLNIYNITYLTVEEKHLDLCQP